MRSHRPPNDKTPLNKTSLHAKKGSLLALALAVLTGTAVVVAAMASGSVAGSTATPQGVATSGDSNAMDRSHDGTDRALARSAYSRSHSSTSRTYSKPRWSTSRTYSKPRWSTSRTWHPRKPRSTTSSTTTSSTTTSSTTTSSTATSTPTATSSTWPGSGNTGVPSGTTLTKYSGPCTITSTVTITAMDATGCSAILVKAKGVVITKSKLPRIDATAGGTYSVSVSDSTVLGGTWSDGAIWGYNITALRVNVTGGQHSFHCADNCSVTDSWLHDQYNPSGQSYHNNAFITNGGSNMLIRHNTLHCTAILNSTDGGCTANVSLFGDFDPVDNVTVDNNLLKANNSSISYCAYGGYQPSKPYPVATNIKFTNNVFERGANRKCGVYGPVTSFQTTATGNVWTNNKFDDGVVINP